MSDFKAASSEERELFLKVYEKVARHLYEIEEMQNLQSNMVISVVATLLADMTLILGIDEAKVQSIVSTFRKVREPLYGEEKVPPREEMN